MTGYNSVYGSSDTHEYNGWFADIDTDQTGTHVWQPCLQHQPGMIMSMSIWFSTEQDCQTFIRDCIIGHGFAPGEDPDATK